MLDIAHPQPHQRTWVAQDREGPNDLAQTR
jgi:hypothetical protein